MHTICILTFPEIASSNSHTTSIGYSLALRLLNLCFFLSPPHWLELFLIGVHERAVATQIDLFVLPVASEGVRWVNRRRLFIVYVIRHATHINALPLAAPVSFFCSIYMSCPCITSPLLTISHFMHLIGSSSLFTLLLTNFHFTHLIVLRLQVALFLFCPPLPQFHFFFFFFFFCSLPLSSLVVFCFCLHEFIPHWGTQESGGDTNRFICPASCKQGS